MKTRKEVEERLAELVAAVEAETEEEAWLSVRQHEVDGLRECLEMYNMREEALAEFPESTRSTPEFVKKEAELFEREFVMDIEHARRFVELFGAESRGRIDAASWVLGIEPNYELLDDGKPCPEWEDQLKKIEEEIRGFKEDV